MKKQIEFNPDTQVNIQILDKKAKKFKPVKWDAMSISQTGGALVVIEVEYNSIVKDAKILKYNVTHVGSGATLTKDVDHTKIGVLMTTARKFWRLLPKESRVEYQKTPTPGLDRLRTLTPKEAARSLKVI